MVASSVIIKCNVAREDAVQSHHQTVARCRRLRAMLVARLLTGTVLVCVLAGGRGSEGVFLNGLPTTPFVGGCKIVSKDSDAYPVHHFWSYAEPV